MPSMSPVELDQSEKKEKKDRSPRGPQEVDRQVGRNIRSMRLGLGWSQQHLAEKCGLSFQQIQKYERGTNRVAASRLQNIAEAMGIPIIALLSDSAPTKSDLHSVLINQLTQTSQKLPVDTLNNLIKIAEQLTERKAS